jgi:hypothetical protein
MREITYTYEVKEVDTTNKKMKVEYKSHGRNTVLSEFSLPFAGDDVELIIQQHAPVFRWFDDERTHADIEVGKQGLITTRFPDFQ